MWRKLRICSHWRPIILETPLTCSHYSSARTGITTGEPEMVHFSQSFRGSFSAVSTPIFASKVAFFSVFRALHFFLCTIPDFSDFSGPLHHFSQNLTQFSLNFKRDSRFCKSLSNFHRISSEFHRISVILIGVMSKWWYLIKIWEKLQKLLKILLQKFWKSVWKNVYSKSLRW